MNYNYFKITKQTMLGLLLIFFIGTYSAAQSSDTLSECDTYGRIFNNPVDSQTCKYNILTTDGILLNPVEFEPSVPIVDTMLVHFSYELTNNYSCQGEPVIIHCFEVVEGPQACTADIIYYQADCDSVDNGMDCGDRTYLFEAVTNPDAVFWTWMINNNVVSHSESFFYEFPGPGGYHVTLVTMTEDSCVADAKEYIYIEPGSSDSCWVAFRYMDIDSVSYQFSSYSSDSVRSYYWTVDGEHFSNNPGFVIHFEEPGFHEVCLSVEMETGCQATYCDTVQVFDNQDCIADFYYYAIDIEDSISTHADILPKSHTFQFIDKSKGSALTYSWSFGDGTASTLQNPVHTYSVPGVYNVILTISSNVNNCFDSISKPVIVDSITECNAYFEYCSYSTNSDDSTWTDTVSSGEDKLYIGFKNLSAPDGYRSSWNFGDGTTSTEKNPVHRYAQSGIYTVCLTIYSAHGCTDTYCDTVEVGMPNCEIDFTFNTIVPDCGGFNIAYEFNPVTNTGDASFKWSFGDGEFSSDDNPLHVYENYGIYEVCLHAYFEDGCDTYECKKIVFAQDTIDKAFVKSCYATPAKDLESQQSVSVKQLYPLPVRNTLSFMIESEKEQKIQIELVDILGKHYELSTNGWLSAGENHIELSLDGLKTGSYIYIISGESSVARGNIIIVE